MSGIEYSQIVLKILEINLNKITQHKLTQQQGKQLCTGAVDFIFLPDNLQKQQTDCFARSGLTKPFVAIYCNTVRKPNSDGRLAERDKVL